jgi:DNA-binding MarR family transcriptional regulator
MLNLSKPAVTKHVKILEGAGLVTRTIVGRTHRLGLAPAGLSHVERWLEYHRRLWESKFDAIERYLERG